MGSCDSIIQCKFCNFIRLIQDDAESDPNDAINLTQGANTIDLARELLLVKITENRVC